MQSGKPAELGLNDKRMRQTTAARLRVEEVGMCTVAVAMKNYLVPMNTNTATYRCGQS